MDLGIEPDTMVGKYFKTVTRVGGGSFGEIYSGINIITKEEVAIKFESVKIEHPQLLYEAMLCNYLYNEASASDKPVPRIYYAASQEKYNVMVMELLGKNLEDLVQLCRGSLSMRTVLMLAEIMVSRLEFMHAKGFLHRDLKPENFMIGAGQKTNKLYIIDFGLSKKYIYKIKANGTEDFLHAEYRDDKQLTGTARYLSINTHLGIEQSRRDDLESLGYVLVYLYKGMLPWNNIKKDPMKNEFQEILEKKLETPLEILCRKMPKEFLKYFKYVRNLAFDECPDYKYLKKLFSDFRAKLNYDHDFEYDWSALLNKKKIEDLAQPKIEPGEKSPSKTEENVKKDDAKEDPKAARKLSPFKLSGLKVKNTSNEKSQ